LMEQEEQNENPDQLSTEVSGFCKKLLTKLSKHKDAWPFTKPVNPGEWGASDYFQIIKHPMDLSTVLNKLKKDEYKNVEQVVHDIYL